MKIKDMRVDQCGRVTGYSGTDRDYRHKLLRMGVNRGAHFKVIRKAPLGDPVEIEVKGFHLTLRKSEADAIDVELISSCGEDSSPAGR